MILAKGCVRKIEKREPKPQVGSVVGVCVGVVEQEEKRKENEVFLGVFTAASGVF